MKLFNITWVFGNNPRIAGSHKWKLPGIDYCPTCRSTWGAAGVEYPAIDISGILNVKPYSGGWPVPLQKLEALREAIRKYFPPESQLLPGTSFGTMVGKALANPGDFAWARLWTPLISETALTSLESEIGAIKAVPAELKFRGKFSAIYYVLHIAQCVRLHDSCIAGTQSCPTCGRIVYDLIGGKSGSGAAFGKQMKINKASIPTDGHIFRIQEFKTYILVTEEFKNAVTKLGLSDIAFIEMNVV